MSGITKRFPGTVALDDVDFRVVAGEVHGLVGQNGAGKSTLVNIMNGSLQPDAGRILVNGREVRIGSPHAAQVLGISMVHQELKLFPNLTVAENVLFGRQAEKSGFVSWARLQERAEEIIRRLAVSFGPGNVVSELGTAQQQQVEIAKALARNCEILILDEPTASLTVDETDVLFSVIRSLVKDGISVVYISHRLEEVFKICDRVTVLRDGRKIDTLAVGETTQDEVVRLMIGESKTLAGRTESETGESREVALEVGHLSIRGKLSNVSFRLYRGEILGLAGLVGSGRTELLQALAGAARMDAGRVVVHGREVLARSPRDAIDAGIALMPEDRKRQGLVLGMSVKHNIAFASLSKFFRLGFLKSAYEASVARALIEELAIKVESADRPVVMLSGGNQQKVVFAKWLFANADVLLLDEPTRGIDVGAKEEVFKVIRRLAAGGKSVIFVSSELEEVIRLSDRILVLHDKRIVAELPRGSDIGVLLHHAMGVKTA
ncbi:MAG TPA: sugar ABC transporter ATP-binding protein [Spirochaetia bacterium]|nr:sugar ABC transporter ATP-binding protein [Spirochaetia bacterium]